MHNLLTDPLIRAVLSDSRTARFSLPEIFAALTRDEITSFPGLRPHQAPSWHMFLCQLGALVLHGAGRTDLPNEAEDWQEMISGLTSDFPDDEPWQLVVEDRQKPAFMQPPEPEEGAKYTGTAQTPDALDMLITSKNHDLKQAVGMGAQLDEWIFALVSLQTGEGFNGSGNYGIARMNGGSSSRVCMGLAPIQSGQITVMPGARFGWDVQKLLRDRSSQIKKYLDLDLGCQPDNGLTLLWVESWPDGEQFQMNQLDIWFIEICRRVRLRLSSGSLEARTGTTKAARINAKALNGVCGDGWAPINLKDKKPKSLTLGERDFDYRRMSDILLGTDWQLPPMLTLSRQEEKQAANWLLIAQAIGRGNSKTYGYRERIIPLSLKVARSFSLTKKKNVLGEVSREQIEEITRFKKLLAIAIASFVEGGSGGDVSKEDYELANPYRDRLDKFADELFFPALWVRFEASQTDGDDFEVQDAVRLAFLLQMHEAALALLNEAIGSLPCPVLYRHRASIRATRLFDNMILSERHGFPILREDLNKQKEAVHDAV